MIEKILNIWSAGGWVMWPLLALAVLMFFTAARLWLDLGARQFRRLSDEQWKLWVRKPEKGEGEVGEMIRYAQDEVSSASEISTRFAEVATKTLPPIDRQTQLLGTFVSAAPLVGLLGTVFGMLVTFQALAGGGGGKVTEAMAAGISQALFPPEVGLCIALPGLIFLQLIKRRRQEFEAFLARVESYTVQWNRAKTGLPFIPSPDASAESKETADATILMRGAIQAT
ncbi:MAG TPA: MotA/TolQ/ExbB proton channel family protein [Verrucomicrobiota bacterium]|nr:MotA/TolQ/ExbB proton channel family protein [Verrucomicrobiota bacterium]